MSLDIDFSSGCWLVHYMIYAGYGVRVLSVTRNGNQTWLDLIEAN